MQQQNTKKTIRERMEDKLGVKVVKGLIYGFTRFIIIFIVILIASLAFNIGMNSMNVYMMAKDGFVLRAEQVLQHTKESEDRLASYFTESCIRTDEMLSSDIYFDYKVTNYYERADIEDCVVCPWQDEITITVYEQVMDITGTYSADYLRRYNLTEEDVKNEEVVIPEWKNGEYKVTLLRPSEEKSSWIIDKIEYIGPAEDKMMHPLELEAETE